MEVNEICMGRKENGRWVMREYKRGEEGNVRLYLRGKAWQLGVVVTRVGKGKGWEVEMRGKGCDAGRDKWGK